ncbi:MAG: tRNA (guanine-N(7)-)-methyltransferase [Bacteroidota bacterium]|nr:MAG: tRNA (guanine-N(7)-)-methyltransferase [Bacteroidetes bacterium OLB12]GIL24731.1 MAG: tRNA (guanine-N(7)-)-methyltransferase [Bacteroidota bacterium]HNR73876.1 tRNA (guanosine(46)-N7)-methyltransferase TrmB [Cyclobacteriaceae bacterium]
MKSKLKRFEIISQRDNVLEPGKDIYLKIKGNWNKDYFKRDKPITLELACGRGEYTVGMAKLFPDRNFIGVDKKGDRLWKGSTWAVEDQLNHVGFLRTEILFIESFIADGEVDEIWLTFPDPRPRIRDSKRRLSSSGYITMYKKLLKPGGYFRFKTDNTDLFNFTLEELALRTDMEDFKFTHDLYNSDLRSECYDIKTKYEEMFAGKGEKIKYLRFRFKKEIQ